MNTDTSAAMDAGIARAADADPAKARQYAREEADVRRWQEAIQQARKYDEPARKQYAMDRRQARGDSGFEVDDNITGTNIDILESYLYARNPDFDVTPGPAVRPPSIDSLRDAVELGLAGADQASVAAGQRAAAMAGYAGLPVDEAMAVGLQASEAAEEQMIRDRVAEMLKAFRRRQREIKAFAETCEIVGARMWDDASLKRRGRPLVRSGLTVGLGVLKGAWQERTEASPETQTAINDLQANINRLQALKRELTDGNLMQRAVGTVRSWLTDDDAKLAEFERQMQALQSNSERVVERGFVIDNVAAEDFQVALGYTIANHLDAPWNAHRIFMRLADAKAEFGDYLVQVYGENGVEKLDKATRYRPRKPVMMRSETPFLEREAIRAADADSFVTGETDNASFTEGEGFGGDWVCLWEVWDRDSNTVLTTIEGVHCWVKPGWNPKPTTRFYPFFLFATSEVDGQRHPQSLTSRSAKLVNERNRIRSAEAEHRRRILPKMAFNSGQVDKANAEKLEKGAIAEMVGIQLTNPNMNLGDVLQPVEYPQIDQALYDTSRIEAGIERIWGVQEALAGSVDVAKTATEADIQQQGFQARTGSRRDVLETMLGELALYTVETSRAWCTTEDVQAVAGPDAFWPPYEGPNDQIRLLSVNIRAGSSGKPNTMAERQSWGAILPLLQTGITQIGQLRGSSPQAIADSLEQLLRITAERSGERFDIDQLIPTADMALPGVANPIPQAGPAIAGAAPPPQGEAPASTDPLAA